MRFGQIGGASGREIRHILEQNDLYRFQHRPATGFRSAWFGAAEVWGSVCDCVSYGHLFRGTG